MPHAISAFFETWWKSKGDSLCSVSESRLSCTLSPTWPRSGRYLDTKIVSLTQIPENSILPILRKNFYLDQLHKEIRVINTLAYRHLTEWVTLPRFKGSECSKLLCRDIWASLDNSADTRQI